MQVYGRHPGEANLLGGWEMLKRYPDLDAVQLNDLWLRNAFRKLDSGMYCSKIRIDSEDVFLVNGFAPRQIAHYTADDRFIILFDLSARLDWPIIRYDFAGQPIRRMQNPAPCEITCLPTRSVTRRKQILATMAFTSQPAPLKP